MSVERAIRRRAHLHRAILLALPAVAAACSHRMEPPVATPSLRAATDDVPAGSVVDLTYRFVPGANAPALAEDYVVFVHAINAQGERLWTDDHPPPTPTRRWRPGSAIEYSRPMLVPRTTPEGPVALEIGLYSPRTGDRLPLDAPDAGRRAYRVATVRVLPPRPAADAIYMDGWYDREAVGDAAGTAWRWSQREGQLWFRNPRRDVVLVLRIDGSISGVSESRAVDIRVGGNAVDRFELTPGRDEVHRTAIPARALGSEDIARIVLAVDRAIVPADVPASGNGDRRALGVRVFDAYLESASE